MCLLTGLGARARSPQTGSCGRKSAARALLPDSYSGGATLKCRSSAVSIKKFHGIQWNLHSSTRSVRSCLPNSEIRSVSTVKDVKIACMYIMYSDPCLQARQDCQTPRFSAMDHQRSCLRSLLSRGDALEKQYVKRVPIDQLSPINQLFQRGLVVGLCK